MKRISSSVLHASHVATTCTVTMRPTCCCLSAARSSMGALRPSAPVFATPKSPRSRLSAVLASKDATASKLTLQHFVLRGEAISLYRKFLRATRDIPNPEARLETVEWIRSDFDRTRIETDLERIRDYLMQGHRQLKQLQGPFQLSNATQDFAKLRGRRKPEAVA